jgi:periplasmic protein TonB
MPKQWLKFLPAAAIVILIVLALLAGWYLKKLFHKDEAPQKKMVQQITMINPPPPPPPPPPKEEIKEPEIKEEPIKEQTEAPPKDAPAEAAAPEAAAGAATGNDGFGLGKNTGRAWGGGLGGAYEQSVRQEINEFILENARLKHMDYIAVLTLKIGDGGEFEQYDVQITGGDAQAGDIIRKILADKRKLAKPRPLEAASVVKLRIKSAL